MLRTVRLSEPMSYKVWLARHPFGEVSITCDTMAVKRPGHTVSEGRVVTAVDEQTCRRNNRRDK